MIAMLLGGAEVKQELKRKLLTIAGTNAMPSV